jgi:hypothetical protein
MAAIRNTVERFKCINNTKDVNFHVIYETVAQLTDKPKS